MNWISGGFNKANLWYNSKQNHKILHPKKYCRQRNARFCVKDDSGPLQQRNCYKNSLPYMFGLPNVFQILLQVKYKNCPNAYELKQILKLQNQIMRDTFEACSPYHIHICAPDSLNLKTQIPKCIVGPALICILSSYLSFTHVALPT